MYRIMTAAAASLLLTSAALAQTTPNTFTTAQQDVFMNEQGTMRTQDEAKTKFSALSAEDQASLRATCAQIDSASGSTGTTTDTTTTGSTTGTTSGSASGTATGTTTTMQMADMQQACQWVQGF